MNTKSKYVAPVKANHLCFDGEFKALNKPSKVAQITSKYESVRVSSEQLDSMIEQKANDANNIKSV